MIVRQHQAEAEDEHQMDALAGGDFGRDAPSDPPRPEPAAAPLPALSHVLVAQLSVSDAITQGLILGADLLGNRCSLRLFAADIDTGTDARSLRQVAGLAYANDGCPYTSGEDATSSPTLGGGPELDRQVLLDHLTVHSSGTSFVPLTTSSDTLVGVLVVTRRDTAERGPDAPLVTLLAAHLTVLLERRARERMAQYNGQVLAAIARLGSPIQIGAGMDERDACKRLLHEAGDVLRRVAQPRSLLAVALFDGGEPYALDLISGGDATALSPEQVATAHAVLRVGVPFSAMPLGDADHWRALASLRDLLSPPSLDAAEAADISRLTLVPVISADTPLALFLLAHTPSKNQAEVWLPLAAAVAAALAAGVQAVRQAGEAVGEARNRDAFVSLAAHELRSPLTSIKGYSQLLIRQARKSPLPESMLRSVEAVEQQSMRMAEMVGELLDASRIQRGTLELTPASADLVPIATKTVERRRVFLPQQLILEVEEPSLVGMWDALRVEQIVRDLVDNASRFSPEGNAVVVRVSREGSMALVSVHDEGIGVAADDRERIFEYLYRAPTAEHRNLAGLGLGLFLSRNLAEHMGGRLLLHSTSTEAPTGSEFRLLLPLA